MMIKLTMSMLVLLTGCASTQLTSDEPTITSAPPPPPPPAQIILDGELDDWYGQTGIRADNDEVFICFESFDESQAIQAADFTTRIRIDADADSTTGMRQMYHTKDEASGQAMMLSQGVDLTIDISPEGRDFGTLRGGSNTRLHTANATQRVNHSDVGFYFLPTHNSPRYEARLDRSTMPLLQHEGAINIVVEHRAIGGQILRTQSFNTTLPRYSQSKPVDQTIAQPPKNGVRVMSSNVLYSSPLKDPEPFVRVLDAMNPDVVLYQEWFKTTKDDVRAWIDEHLGKDWSLIMSDDGSGVAIATKLKVIESVNKAVVEHRGDRPSRVIAAVVEAHGEQQILISLHLKCCGGAGSDEDAKRIMQASQIHDLVKELRSRYPDAGVVIGGDYNLVGSRIPLEVMADGIGSDGQDLVPVPTTCLGTQSMLTWTDADSSFTPGRLDWLLIDDHAWTPIRSWSLDTAHLSDRVLQDSGLKREDSRASDHLPIFVDLVPSNE
jgi:exonuclease III